MKTFSAAIAMLVVARFCLAGTSALDDLIDSGQAPAYVDSIMYPALPGELPAETEARRPLLKLLDRLKEEGKLTTELELQIRAQIAAILAAESARIAKEHEKTVIVVDDR